MGKRREKRIEKLQAEIKAKREEFSRAGGRESGQRWLLEREIAQLERELANA